MSTMQAIPSQTLSIPKLLDDGSNWVDYEIKARTAMGSKGLIRHVEGKARKPTPYAEVNGKLMVDATTPATDDQIDAKERVLDEYEQKEYLTRHIILTTVSPRLFATIKDKTSSADMWITVKADATAKTELHQIDTRRQLHQKKCGENDDMKAHLEELVNLRGKLIGMGATVEDAKFRTIILSSLPLSYRSIISAITVSASLTKAKVENDHLIRIITEEAESRLILEGNSAGAGSALTATDKPVKGNRQQRQKKNRPKCYNCNKPGHTKAECWAKGGGMEGQGPKQKGGKEKASANTVLTKPEEDSPPQEYAFVTNTQASHMFKILLDSGASSHFCPDRSKFKTFVESKTIVNTADGRSFIANGKGDVDIEIPSGASITTVTLKDAIYAPEMASTLISISKLDKNGYFARFGSGACMIMTLDKKTIGSIPLLDGLYQTKLATAQIAQTATTTAHTITINEAHRLLGHISRQTIRNGIRNGKICGLTISDPENTVDLFCEICAQSKPTRKPFPQEASNRSKNLGDRMHADLWGPAQVISLGGARYTIDFTDDATRYTWIDFLKTKDEALDAFKKLETQYSARIKIGRTDRGTELKNKKSDKYFAERGIRRELTTHDTHEQVGVAERYNRFKAEIIRAILIESGLLRFLWAEAAQHATWIKNRVPTRALNGISPFEALHGKAPDLSMLVPFGTHVWVKDLKAKKLDRRSKHGRFIGFDWESRGHRIYFEGERRIGIEREVLFDRDRPLADDKVEIDTEALTKLIELSKVVEQNENDQTWNLGVNEPEKGDEDDQPLEDPKTDDPDAPKQDTPTKPRSPKTKVVPKVVDGLIEADPTKGRGMRARPVQGYFRKVNEGAALASECDAESQDVEYTYLALPGDEPESVEEALNGPDAREWEPALKAELDVLERHKTWRLVERPHGKPVIPCHFILRTKRRPDGDIAKRKA